jgi:hypothetical protein
VSLTADTHDTVSALPEKISNVCISSAEICESQVRYHLHNVKIFCLMGSLVFERADRLDLGKRSVMNESGDHSCLTAHSFDSHSESRSDSEEDDHRDDCKCKSSSSSCVLTKLIAKFNHFSHPSGSGNRSFQHTTNEYLMSCKSELCNSGNNCIIVQYAW